jgi:alpha-ribazole phosphatase/probable phosphoglycerate mutase
VATDTKKITIDLIRHGEPEGGHIVRGRVNPVLTPLGWEQMRLAAGLNDDYSPSSATPGFSRIVTSPLSRCRDFAQRLGVQAGLEVSVNELWQEIDYGDWDGMPAEEWRKVAADQFRAFREDITALAPPNGETFLDFRDRVLSAWDAILEYDDGEHVLLVTHGGVLRVILPMVLGMPMNRSFPLYIPFACFSRVSIDIRDGRVQPALIFHNGAEYSGSWMDLPKESSPG